ncbi:MAG: reverse transcriptase domain-containing protein [Exilibacterium sp.]
MRTEIPQLVDENGRKGQTDNSKANLLVSQFAKVANHVPSPLSLFADDDDRAPPCPPGKVLEFIQKTPACKAAGPDEMPMRLLRECKDELCVSIARLADRCLAEGKFPEMWKEAVVAPIPKEGDSPNPADYRPISLLPLVSKIAERWVYELLYPMIDGRLSENQFGFRKGRSTTDALALLQHAVTEGFDLCSKARCYVKSSSCPLDF